MSGGTIAASGTRAEALTIQSSTEGMCIPWLRGMHRLPGNLIWYGDFRAVSSYEKAGGKGGSPKVEKVGYEASFVMAICHGAIHSVPRIWKGKGVTTPAALGLSVFTGALGQGVWSPLLGRGDQSLGYSGLACVGGYKLSLGQSASIENHSFEVRHPSAYGVNGGVPDVDPSTATFDLLTDTTVGAGVPAGLLGSWSDWSTYCRAADLLMSPVLTTQVTAREALETIADLTNTAIVWSGGVLKMLPYGDQALTANGSTFTPNLTPIYELDDSALLVNNGSPIKRQLKTPADRFNSVSVEFKDRTDNYAVTVVTAKDLTDINANGVRAMDVVQAHWITRASVARQVAEVKKQRSLLVQGEYTIRLPWHYALIECMDLLTLTDSVLGLDKVPVRVKSITEDSDEELTLVCEDYPLGVANAPLYPTQASSGFAGDAYGAPPSVTSLTLFEAPGLLADGALGLEVWAAARNPGGNWGGCTVWVSLDGVQYRAMGRVEGGARVGQVGAGGVTDVATSLGVTGLSGQLISGSSTDAAALTTLCYLGGANPEFLAYETAILMSPGAYALGGLVRNVLGGSAQAHAAGDPFVRVDEGVAKSGALDAALIGRVLSFKVTSFNAYGAMEQSLADVSPFTYTVAGTFVLSLSGGGAGFQLQSTAQAFTFDGTNAAKPTSQTIVFKASTATATWEAKRYDVTGALIDDITASLTGTGATRSLAVADFGAAHYTVVKATQGADSDQVTIHRLRDGAAGVTGFLTNEAHVVVTDAAGNGGNFGSALGVFEVFDGVTRKTLSGQVTYSYFSSSGIPAGNAPIDANGNYQVTGMTAGFDQGTVKFRAVYGGVTIDKIFSISKSKTGTAGSNGLNGLVSTRVFIYQRSAAGAPALPSVTTSYTFSSGTLTGLNNGWSTTVPAGTDPLYVSAATASAEYVGGSTFVSLPSGVWAAASLLAQNGAAGSAGVNAATVFLYQRSNSTTAPSAPGSALTYTFSTGLLSGTLGSWTQTVPAASGGKYLYVTTATALSTSGADSIASGEWSTVRQMAADGARGPVNIAWAVASQSTLWKFGGSGSGGPADTAATAAISSATGGDVPRSYDIVTLYVAGTSFSETRILSPTPGNGFVPIDAFLSTDQLMPGAATLVASTQVTGPINVVNDSGSFPYGNFQVLASVTFTPDPTTSGPSVILVHAVCNWNLAAGGTADWIEFLIGDPNVYDPWGARRGGSGTVSAGQSANGTMTLTQAFTKTGNQSVTFQLRARGFAYNVRQAGNIELRAEVVRR